MQLKQLIIQKLLQFVLLMMTVGEITLYHSLSFISYLHYKAYAVTVGLQQTAYTVTEVDDYQLVCFEVLSGDVDGRELVFSYSTVSGTASKLVAIEVPSMFKSHFLYSHK